jgi:putative Ca2+/H+ antiporter (TMEM165/GDT1 family)
MKWQALVSTFMMLLLAELGDKTQIAVILQASKFQSPWAVLVGASVALTVVSALGVCIGHVCGIYLPRELIRYAAGGIFIVMGILMLLKVI